MIRSHLLLPVLILAGMSVGCASIQKPTATFKSMQVANVTPQGFTMNFAIDLNNPNSMALPLSTADYKLGLAGVNVLDGKAKPSGTIPANGSAAITLPVNVTFENLLAVEQALSKTGGNVPYTFEGGLDIEAGDGSAGGLFNTPVRVPLQYSGTLALRELLKDPKVLLNSPAAQKLAQQILGSLFSR